MEINETPREIVDTQTDLSKFQSIETSDSAFRGSIESFVNEIRDIFKPEELPIEARDYGVEACTDCAKDCFTPEVINEWPTMTLEERNEVIQSYAAGIGKGLDINFEGVIWEEFPIEDGAYTFGYNQGDGFLHLNVDMLCDPSYLMQVISTVAHEARHQFQVEAIENPEKYNIDDATLKEWEVAQAIYTLDQPSAYDPWGYTFNPLEIDSRYFGETVVRELTKDLISNIA